MQDADKPYKASDNIIIILMIGCRTQDSTYEARTRQNRCDQEGVFPAVALNTSC